MRLEKVILLIIFAVPNICNSSSFTGQIHQEVSFNKLKEQQQEFAAQLNRIELWEASEELPIGQDAELLSKSTCGEQIEHIDNLLETYFYALHLQKLAIDCHNLLNQPSSAAKHENHVLNIAKLVTESGDGKSFKTAFWTTDINSAYEFIDLAGFTVIDGELKLTQGKTYLAVLTKTEDTFGEFRYFQMDHYFKSINQTVSELLTEEESKYFVAINLVLKSDLENNEGLINLAMAGMTEAQILLAKMLLGKTKMFPTLYKDAFYLLSEASNSDSVIAKYNLAYRIFIDKMEDKYSLGHDLITDALAARYLPAMTLAAIVREQKLGIKKDKETIADIISLLEENGEPGKYELLIGRSLLSDRMWNNHKLAKKYLTMATDKNNPEAMVLMGDMYADGYAVKQSDKKAMEWYQEASKTDQSGLAHFKIGVAMVTGGDSSEQIPLATQYLIKSGELGYKLAFASVGRLYYYKIFKQVNYAKAFSYFKKGHDKGDPSGTLNMAKSLYHGHGVEQDYHKAFELLTSIEDESLFDTEIYLGAVHFNGQGTPKDLNKALKIYRKIILGSNQYNKNKKNIILANLNLRLAYMGFEGALTPADDLVDTLNLEVAQNDSVAMFKLGYLMYMNYEAEMTRSEGVEWFKKAAALGIPYAHAQLANYYRWEKNNAQMEHHLEQAKKLGDPETIYKMAKNMLEDDPKMAIQMLQQSAEKNHIYALSELADLHTQGKHVNKNFDQALAYQQQAYDSGDIHALTNITDMYINQQISSQQFSNTISLLKQEAESTNDPHLMRQVAKFYSLKHLPDYNPEQTIHWYIRAYEAGNTEAIIELGKHYMYGIGIDQDFNLAQFFFANSINKPLRTWGDIGAEPGSFWVALMLQKGLGLEQDLELARELYAKNFDSSRNKEALNNYAVMTCQADNAEKKEQKNAFKIIKERSEKSRTALFNLAWMYEHGICTKQKTEAAIKAYQSAAKKNSPHALYRLYQMYRDGEHVNPDQAKAAEFLKRSVESSKKVLYHNMMSTFLDLPYIKNLKLVEPES